MHVNNETGVINPIADYCTVLEDHDAYLHVDAAQGFGKLTGIEFPRIDLLSNSGHKIYAPKGVGALITRKRKWSRPHAHPLMFGGGQEKGLRPGTHPVPLIAGLGLAAELGLKERSQRHTAASVIKNSLLEAFAALGAKVHGLPECSIPTTLNLSIPGVDAEAALLALQDGAAISNGSACTSQSYSHSHVLEGMGLADEEIAGALRLSWGPFTTELEPETLAESLASLAR
jgi:cysteine desulfurase